MILRSSSRSRSRVSGWQLAVHGSLFAVRSRVLSLRFSSSSSYSYSFFVLWLTVHCSPFTVLRSRFEVASSPMIGDFNRGRGRARGRGRWRCGFAGPPTATANGERRTITHSRLSGPVRRSLRNCQLFGDKSSVVGSFALPLLVASAQHLLENVDANESIELAPNLFEHSDMNKTHTLIQVQTFFAPLCHSRDERVKS